MFDQLERTSLALTELMERKDNAIDSLFDEIERNVKHSRATMQ
jgi:hypothetical protein